jgi:hypothetical protein
VIGERPSAPAILGERRRPLALLQRLEFGLGNPDLGQAWGARSEAAAVAQPLQKPGGMNLQRLSERTFRKSPQAGEPGVGSTVAYKDTASPTGWDLGVVKMIDCTVERLNYVLATATGWLVVNRGHVLRWWPAA